MGTNNSDLLSQSMVEDSTLPPGALMAKLQHLPPYTSCWRPPASDTDRTVSPLGTSSARQSPTQLSSFDQSISSSYSHPLSLLHDAPLIPLFSLPVWSLFVWSSLPVFLVISPSLSSQGSVTPLISPLSCPLLSFLRCQYSVLENLSFPTLLTLGAWVTMIGWQIILLSVSKIIQPAEASLGFPMPGTTLSFKNEATDKTESFRILWSSHPIRVE